MLRGAIERLLGDDEEEKMGDKTEEGTLGGYFEDITEVKHYLETERLVVKYGRGGRYETERLEGVKVLQLNDVSPRVAKSFTEGSVVVFKPSSSESWVGEVSPNGQWFYIDKE